jgi:SSS family solute:Na+ symporter
MFLVLALLVVYFVAMVGISLLLKEKNETLDGFFLGRRSISLPVIVLTTAATYIGATATLGKSGLAYQSGLSAMLPTVATFFAFSLYSVFAGRIRRVGAEYNISSIPELIKYRFGKAPSLFAAVIILWTLTGTVGTQMIASSRILEMILSEYRISYQTSLIFITIVIIIYTSVSGFYGVAYTDVIQGVIMLIIVSIILPISLDRKIGGLAQLRQMAPDAYFSLKPNRSLISYGVVYFLYFVAGPPYWQRSLAASSSKTARLGAFGGNIIIVFYSLMVTFVGIYGLVLHPNLASGQHEMIIPIIIKQFFSPFLYAAFVVSLFAILMSTIDSYLLIAAQTLTMDILKTFKPDIEKKRSLRISKIAVVFLGFMALIFALQARGIVESLVLSMSFFASCIAIPTMATLLSRRATFAGVMSSMIMGLAVAIFWKNFLHTPYGISDAIVGSSASLVILVIVSFFTRNQKSVFFDSRS